MHIANRDRRVEVFVVLSFFLQLLFFITKLLLFSKVQIADCFVFPLV
jgi:hypothetical protein